MGFIDDNYTSPEEVYLQYQAGRYSELNGEVDREAASGTAGGASPFTPGSGGGTIVFNPQCFLGETIFNFFDGDGKTTFAELFKEKEQYIGKSALSFDKHNRAVKGEILDVFENEVDSYLIVTFSDGERLRVVKEHRFLCADYEYRQIGSLLGELVMNGDGKAVTVVTYEVFREKVKVYNASIKEFKNYCVGQTKKRCHNLKPARSPDDL